MQELTNSVILISHSFFALDQRASLDPKVLALV